MTIYQKSKKLFQVNFKQIFDKFRNVGPGNYDPNENFISNKCRPFSARIGTSKRPTPN